jgi:hypothetical protein
VGQEGVEDRANGKASAWDTLTLEDILNDLKDWRNGESVVEVYPALLIEWTLNELAGWLDDYEVKRAAGRPAPSGAHVDGWHTNL